MSIKLSFVIVQTSGTPDFHEIQWGGKGSFYKKYNSNIFKLLVTILIFFFQYWINPFFLWKWNKWKIQIQNKISYRCGFFFHISKILSLVKRLFFLKCFFYNRFLNNFFILQILQILFLAFNLAGKVVRKIRVWVPWLLENSVCAPRKNKFKNSDMDDLVNTNLS